MAQEVPKAIKVQGKRATQAWKWAQQADLAARDWATVQELDRAIEMALKYFEGHTCAVVEMDLRKQLRVVLDRIEARGAEWGEPTECWVPSAKARAAGAKGGARGKGTKKVRRTRRERMGDF